MAAAELNCCAAASAGTDASIKKSTIQRTILRDSASLFWNLTARFHRTTLEAHLAAGTRSRLKVLSRFSGVAFKSQIFGEPFSSRSPRLDGR